MHTALVSVHRGAPAPYWFCTASSSLVPGVGLSSPRSLALPVDLSDPPSLTWAARPIAVPGLVDCPRAEGLAGDGRAAARLADRPGRDLVGPDADLPARLHDGADLPGPADAGAEHGPARGPRQRGRAQLGRQQPDPHARPGDRRRAALDGRRRDLLLPAGGRADLRLLDLAGDAHPPARARPRAGEPAPGPGRGLALRARDAGGLGPAALGRGPDRARDAVHGAPADVRARLRDRRRWPRRVDDRPRL